MSGRSTRRPLHIGPWLASTAILAITFSLQVRADGGEGDALKPEAVPNRPTVSTPAALSAPGWLEAEAGGLYLRDGRADADPKRRASLPYSLKLAFTPNWGVRIDGEGWVRRTAVDGTHEMGFGDTSFVVKRRFPIDADSAFGIEGGVTTATGRQGLGFSSGKPDYAVNAIYSADSGDWHTDLNLLNTRLGAANSGEGRWQILGAAALSRRLDDRWGVVGELSGTHRHKASATAQVLLAVTYAPRRSMVLDFGVAHALNRATPEWQVLCGVTMVVGRLW